VFAVVLIGDFSPRFGATLPLLHAVTPGMEALTQDNDTWTHIGLAAARVLTQIEQRKDFDAREQQQTDRDGDRTNNDTHGAERACVVIENKRATR
jgi:hypothetical protein